MRSIICSELISREEDARLGHCVEPQRFRAISAASEVYLLEGRYAAIMTRSEGLESRKEGCREKGKPDGTPRMPSSFFESASMRSQPHELYRRWQ